MAEAELVALDGELGLGWPEESYGETAARLRSEGDNDHAEIYAAMETRWWSLDGPEEAV